MRKNCREAQNLSIKERKMVNSFDFCCTGMIDQTNDLKDLGRLLIDVLHLVTFFEHRADARASIKLKYWLCFRYDR